MDRVSPIPPHRPDDQKLPQQYLRRSRLQTRPTGTPGRTLHPLVGTSRPKKRRRCKQPWKKHAGSTWMPGSFLLDTTIAIAYRAEEASVVRQVREAFSVGRAAIRF